MLLTLILLGFLLSNVTGHSAEKEIYIYSFQIGSVELVVQWNGLRTVIMIL